MKTTMLTTTERAQGIRNGLKRAGIPSRAVSVRSSSFSMGSSIDISVKDISVRLDIVKAIAQQHEDVRRDEYTGEILGGGNRYVSVSYDSDALRSASDAYLPEAEKIVARCTPGTFEPIACRGTLSLVYYCDGPVDSKLIISNGETFLYDLGKYGAHNPRAIAEGLALFHAAGNFRA